MKRFILFGSPGFRSTVGLSVLGGLIISAVAMANEPARPAAAKTSGNVSAEMKVMDQNLDGSISSAEHAAGAKKMFENMDGNRDGSVTAAEMDASRPGMGMKETKDGMSSAEKIKVVDTNADGVLTAAEHAAGSEQMFTKMDVDQDGSLTANEIEAGHRKLMSAKRPK